MNLNRLGVTAEAVSFSRHMKLMKNRRTGRVAVYDAAVIATGMWIPVEDEQPAQQTNSPTDEDEILLTDDLSICLKRSSGESIECEA